MKGKLLHRPPKGGGVWKVVFVELIAGDEDTPKRLRIGNEEDSLGVEGPFEFINLDPTCSVFETNIGPHAFEIVTPRKISHFISESYDITSQWITKLRKVISTCKLDMNDTFIRSIAERIDIEREYEVEFLENKPLGVVLERSNESAIVKLSNFKESGIEAGSVITKINGVSVESAPYHETIAALKEWRPPLCLGFKRSPSRCGFLRKYTKDKAKCGSRVWRNRFFCLEAGHLQYGEAQHAPMKGDIPLMGSSVSILARKDFGSRCCFRILSGVSGVILQAEDFNSMMDWVTQLHHAISMANGSKHLLQLQAIRAESLVKEKDGVAMIDSLEDGATNQNIAGFPVKEDSKKLEQSPSCVNELMSFDNGSSSVGEAFSNEVSKEFSNFSYGDNNKENAGSSSKDDSIDVNPSDIVFNEYFMKSLANTIPSSGNSETRNRDILDLLHNAIKLGFKAELTFAIHVAERFNFNIETHEHYRIYDKAKRVLVDVLRVEHQENSHSPPDINFDIRHDSSMDLSDECIPVDKDSNLLECSNLYTTSDQHDSHIDTQHEESDPNSHRATPSIEGELPVQGKECIRLARRFNRRYKLDSKKPATDDDLRVLYRIFTKQMTTTESLNPIQLSTIWRIVTGEKGNLFKEMELFSQFDVKNNGCLCEDDFVEGILMQSLLIDDCA